MGGNSTFSLHARLGASAAWAEHFRRSLARPEIVRADEAVELTLDEVEAIATSVQEFQLGESSEGRHLISAANRYAAWSGDLEYVAALRLFIAEENRHARELGRFLDGAGIPRVKAAWPDTVFRFLRRRAGLELSIVVLVTAEIIAKVYYAALRDATGSSVLQRLCRQILRDERQHVTFQSQRVALLRARRSRWSIRIRVALHRVLMAGTCVVVWRHHGRAMRAGGFGFRRFWRATWREMRRAMAEMDPRNYPALTGRSAKPRSGGRGTLVDLPIVLRPTAAPRLGAPRAPRPSDIALQLTSEDVT
jgi:hypothetical protein